MHPNRKTTSKDIARLMASMLLLLVAIGSFGYLISRFGLNPLQKKQSITLRELIMPGKQDKTLTKANNTESGQVAGVETTGRRAFEVVDVPSPKSTNKDTVQFVRSEDGPKIKYQDVLYAPQTSFKPEVTQLTNSERYPWQNVIEAPKDVGAVNDVYAFVMPEGSKVGAFVMRWGGNSVSAPTRYAIYIFSEGKNQVQVSKIGELTDEGEAAVIPKLAGITPDGKFLNLALFKCDSCTSEIPITLLVDTKTGTYVSLGQTSEVSYIEGQKFAYKIFQEIPCPEDSTAKCAIDPQYLEAKNVQVE